MLPVLWNTSLFCKFWHGEQSVLQNLGGKRETPQTETRLNTRLILDGSKGRRGGRPQITLHDPWLPYDGKRTNKDSLTATLVCGSNAAGEALPSHFQFQTKATTDEGERLRNEVFRHVP